MDITQKKEDWGEYMTDDEIVAEVNASLAYALSKFPFDYDVEVPVSNSDTYALEVHIIFKYANVSVNVKPLSDNGAIDAVQEAVLERAGVELWCGGYVECRLEDQYLDFNTACYGSFTISFDKSGQDKSKRIGDEYTAVSAVFDVATDSWEFYLDSI